MSDHKPRHIIMLETALQEIATQVTTEERSALARHLKNMDVRTLNTYLSGEVKAIDTAKKIVTGSREFIKTRDREIERLTKAVA